MAGFIGTRSFGGAGQILVASYRAATLVGGLVRRANKGFGGFAGGSPIVAEEERERQEFRAAVVGSGPAGMYTAQRVKQ